MYHQWCQDQEDQQELGKMIAILSGSFTNPEAAKNMLKAENPDHVSTEEDFEESLKLVVEQKEPKRKRRRKTVKT